jgi:hypothetical protein
MGWRVNPVVGSKFFLDLITSPFSLLRYKLHIKKAKNTKYIKINALALN